MPLSERENEIWLQSVRQFRGAEAEPGPVHLYVDDMIETPIEMWYAIESNTALRKISDEDTRRAYDFMDLVIKSDDPAAVLASLKYEQGAESLEVILPLFDQGEINGL